MIKINILTFFLICISIIFLLFFSKKSTSILPNSYTKKIKVDKIIQKEKNKIEILGSQKCVDLPIFVEESTNLYNEKNNDETKEESTENIVKTNTDSSKETNDTSKQFQTADEVVEALFPEFDDSAKKSMASYFHVNEIRHINSLSKEQYTTYLMTHEEREQEMEVAITDFEMGIINDDEMLKKADEIRRKYLLKFINNLTKEQQFMLAEIIRDAKKEFANRKKRIKPGYSED